MKPYISMYHLVITLVLVASGGCWPMFEAEHKLNLSIRQDSQPVGSPTQNTGAITTQTVTQNSSAIKTQTVTQNSSAITNQTVTQKSSAITTQTVTRSKEINTPLGIFAFLLTAGTYWLLMKYTTTLSNGIILPSKFLEDNIAAVLSLTWEKCYMESQVETPDSPEETTDWLKKKASDSAEESTDSHSLPPVLFCNQQDSSDLQIPLGACEFWEEDDTKFSPGSSMVPVRVFSPVMKSLVQIAIWNSVSFWLVLVMIANTLTYNGFMSHNITTDSITRLFLVGVYAAANAGHQCRTTILLYRNFTSVLFQTCWIFICREFIFLDRKLYKDNCKWFNSNDEDQVLFIDMDSRSFIFRLFGMTERSDTYQVPEKSEREIARAGAEKPEEFSPDDEDERYYLMAQKKEESKFDQCVKPSREAEIKAYEKAADAALEKTLANVAVLLGICLSTALAPWASTEKIDATSAQLGSYALLLSVSTGLTALVGSISQLTNTVYSARMLLLFQEKTITANNETHRDEVKANQFSLRDDVDFGFSKSIDGQSQLTWYGLWRSTSSLGQLPWLLFGSALMLIPNFHRNGKTGRSCEDCRHCKTCRNSGKWLCFTVHGVNFTCETYTWYPSVESGSRKEVATSVRPVSADNGVFADNVVSANSGGLANSGTQQKKRVGKVAQQLKPPLPLIPW